MGSSLITDPTVVIFPYVLFTNAKLVVEISDKVVLPIVDCEKLFVLMIKLDYY